MPELQIEVRGDQADGAVHSDRDLIRVGSAETNDLVVRSSQVSPEHCHLVNGPEAACVVDLQSDAGTFVLRGKDTLAVYDQPGHALELRQGDVIRLGSASTDAIEVLVSIGEEEEPAHVVAVRPLGSLAGPTLSDERNRDLLRALGQVHSELARTRDFDAALAVIANAALTLVPRATHATLVLKDADGSAYVPLLTRIRDARGEAIEPRDEVPVTRSVFRKVVRERAAVLAADAPSESFSSESLLGANIKSIIGVPLIRQDEILGVLQVDNRDRPQLFDTVDLEALGILATNASLTLDNARLIRRLSIAEEKLIHENQYLKRRRHSAPSESEIIGGSPALAELMAQLKKVADTRVSVLIQGETGVGKELIATALHTFSRRCAKLFVAQNCAAVPHDLLESELFGHRRGAFTGATEDRRGLFELADGGTLFLDEVSELPLALQAKLLRVLQEREIRPLGATRDKRIDVRVVAACNRNLQDEVRAGRFREDLFYRLNVFPLRVPPLRERRGDVALLAQHFLKRYTREYGNPVLGFSQEALEALSRYDWPGNVRELENEIQRLVIQAEPESFVPSSLLSEKVRGTTVTASGSVAKGTLKQMTEQFERRLVLETLESHGNNKTRAAKDLGITREGLHKKLKQLGID